MRAARKRHSARHEWCWQVADARHQWCWIGGERWGEGDVCEPPAGGTQPATSGAGKDDGGARAERWVESDVCEPPAADTPPATSGAGKSPTPASDSGAGSDVGARWSDGDVCEPPAGGTKPDETEQPLENGQTPAVESSRKDSDAAEERAAVAASKCALGDAAQEVHRQRLRWSDTPKESEDESGFPSSTRPATDAFRRGLRHFRYVRRL